MEGIDPSAWADAIIKVGWPVPVLAFWYILWRYWPWRKRTRED